MTLPTFISQYDYEGAVVLLEGKRAVLPGDNKKLVALGRLLAESTRHTLFRSGNAEGADFHFSAGVAEVDSTRLQVITPYTGHRAKTNAAYDTVPLDTIDLAAEPEVVYHSRQNKASGTLVDKFMAGERSRHAIKAAYILRDTVKVLGAAGLQPACFGFFYDDPEAPRSGGTGHTIQVCEDAGVPFIDQRVWAGWLAEE